MLLETGKTPILFSFSVYLCKWLFSTKSGLTFQPQKQKNFHQHQPADS
jgi:hypothetical protein